ncbi:hypothetical protein [Shewanella woodyi]|uniref:hypothetical protein n=1 Tax=Shewanella woodyi TaxID=60961 RepID=UPI00374A4608
MKTVMNSESTTSQISAKSEKAQDNRVTIIEDALLESVSGGSVADDGICIGHQFCEIPPHNDRG